MWEETHTAYRCPTIIPSPADAAQIYLHVFLAGHDKRPAWSLELHGKARVRGGEGDVGEGREGKARQGKANLSRALPCLSGSSLMGLWRGDMALSEK